MVSSSGAGIVLVWKGRVTIVMEAGQVSMFIGGTHRPRESGSLALQSAGYTCSLHGALRIDRFVDVLWRRPQAAGVQLACIEKRCSCLLFADYLCSEKGYHLQLRKIANAVV